MRIIFFRFLIKLLVKQVLIAFRYYMNVSSHSQAAAIKISIQGEDIGKT